MYNLKIRRKTMNITARFLTMMMAALSLVACSSDDDDPGTPETPVATAISVTYNVALSEDMVKVADVTVYYVADDAVVKSEKVTAAKWSKPVKVPADKTFGYHIAYAAKPSVQIDPETSYNIKADVSMSYDVKDQKGASMSMGETQRSFGSAVKGEKVAEFLSKLATNAAWRWDGESIVKSSFDWNAQ